METSSSRFKEQIRTLLAQGQRDLSSTLAKDYQNGLI
jgi:hypothetical protein